ncbi:hypothetical protein OKW21_004889 [Catalinimonas alkaloidigena]|uniref:hypothetical protein n=1 Tax=Catalinimonas alkaloidigena TaxID=1075417 RepID=UPI00240742E1|nr:hypothetical protein [Catalinimonas alkaloidigena]MDF9799626.1 hypothetical protein [Catalinimonas alkaloidigena]
MEAQSIRSLNYHDRIRLLKRYGNYLTTRINSYYYIKLYSISGQFVEIWSSSHIPWEGIVKIKVLNNTKALEPYLSKELFQRVAMQ